MDTAPSGGRVGRFPWQAVAALVLVAAVSREAALLFLAAAGLVLWATVEVTGRLALFAVEADLALEPARLVAGEELTAIVRVRNRKALPLPWLEVRLTLPEGVEPAGATLGRPKGWVNVGFAPRGRERVTLRIRLRAVARGAYLVGPIRVRAGDWLGFTNDERTAPVARTLVAYPAPLPVVDRHLTSLRPLAETATRHGLLPDPLRFRGVREHRRGDARKEIHWKASARLRSLQTKLYEPATSLDAIFLVNVASYKQYWIQADPESVEIVISASAELVRHANAAGRQVGLVTNGIDNVTHERPRSALGRGPRSVTRSLEILARLGPYAVATPESVFLRERGRLPWGATLIAMTPKLGTGLAAALLALRRAHHRVFLISVDPPDATLAAHLRASGIVVNTLAAAEVRRAV